MSPGQGPNAKLRPLAVDPSDPDLPVAGTGSLSQVRKSTRGRWRAAVLIGIHVLIAAHAAHFLLSGRTLSPVEPSEAMYSLELGQVNAGFVFLLVALLSTFLFGRFFCGWGCHLVALQDLCALFMRKLGIRPRPFRSRLLLLVPALLAFYMFFWPTVRRLLLSPAADEFPGWTNQMVTDGFWDTFPGPVFAVLTLVTCGFVAVAILGSKGFCTYGCPYGALFVAADQVSPGRILVNDDCDGCAHCTVTCTSNVRIHEEVKRYGMVVDPGCMKCTDCVSVCPKEALRFGFGRPPLLKGRDGTPRREKRYPLSLGEELLVLALAVGATLAFRGLYDGPPLLMAVGLGGLTAFAAVKLWHLARRPAVRLQNLRLKRDGALLPAGWLFAAIGMAWLAFSAHSGFVQWHREWGRYHLDRTEAARGDVLSGAFRDRRYSADHQQAAASSRRHFELADRWGLVDVPEVKLGLAWGQLLAGDAAAAEGRIRASIDLAPERVQLHQNLVEFLLARGRLAEATEALERKMEAATPQAPDHFLLGGLLTESGRYDEAVAQYRACLELAPESAEARYNLGGLLRRMGRPAEAVDQLRAARNLAPDDVDTLIELGLACQAAGHLEEAIDSLRDAYRLNPDSPEARLHLRTLIAELEGQVGG